NPGGENRLNSLVVEGAGKQPRVELTENVFLGYQRLMPSEAVKVGGQEAVCGKGAVSIRAVNCAFGPHATTFRLDGRNEALALEHCSVMLDDRSTVFRLLPDAQARLA